MRGTTAADRAAVLVTTAEACVRTTRMFQADATVVDDALKSSQTRKTAPDIRSLIFCVVLHTLLKR